MRYHALPQSLRAAAIGSAAVLCLSFAPLAQAEDKPFDLNALIEAAKKEAPITVYAVTGKIVEQAEAFTKKYGVKATGKKVGAAAQVELALVGELLGGADGVHLNQFVADVRHFLEADDLHRGTGLGFLDLFAAIVDHGDLRHQGRVVTTLGDDADLREVTGTNPRT